MLPTLSYSSDFLYHYDLIKNHDKSILELETVIAICKNEILLIKVNNNQQEYVM